MVSGRRSAAYDRVVERRRAVALARHFRETEGLSIAQIADRLGRSPATIKAYFYDPSDANKRPSGHRWADQEVASSRITARRGSTRRLHPRRISFSALGWLSSTPGRLAVLMLDRVAERRRAAQLARHYRDQEGLSIAEIARRLGRAEATIKAYLYDPTGDKARAVKARYRGVCRGCGAPTAPRNGKGDAYAYCKRCHPGAIARAMDTGAGSRSDARMASALRRCAVVLRLVAHARTPAWRRCAQTTTGRRMARAVHCHRSVRELGGGRRGRLRRRLSVRASMPLTYERGLALDRL